MLRGAIVGLGNIAVHGHLPAWRGRADVTIVAATDARPEQRAALDAQLPGARWYPTVEALLAEATLDFVDVCTPPSSHAPLITAALERGLHVLCEKPLVHSPDDLAALRALAERTGRVLHTVHNWHHAPIVRRTAELVREGAVGGVRRVVWHTLRTRPAIAVRCTMALVEPARTRATGAWTRRSRAAASSRTTAGTSSTFSSGGSARRRDR